MSVDIMEALAVYDSFTSGTLAPVIKKVCLSVAYVSIVEYLRILIQSNLLNYLTILGDVENGIHIQCHVTFGFLVIYYWIQEFLNFDEFPFIFFVYSNHRFLLVVYLQYHNIFVIFHYRCNFYQISYSIWPSFHFP
jgi:hypothetical protein